MDPVIEDIDLERLAFVIEEQVPPASRVGLITGKTVVRDTIARHLGCSLLTAEQIADTMVSRGMLRYEHDELDPASEGGWIIRPKR